MTPHATRHVQPAEKAGRERNYAAEEAMWRESLAAHRATAERAATRQARGRAQGNAAQALDNLAFLAQRLGAHSEAWALREGALALKRDNADALGIGLSLLALGALALRREITRRLVRRCVSASTMRGICATRGLRRERWRACQKSPRLKTRYGRSIWRAPPTRYGR